MIYLASASPRRAELLRQIALPFSVVSCAVDERVRPDETATDYVARLAQEKARAGWAISCATRHDAVLAADTSVVVDGVVLGKPHNEEDAVAMWRLLQGRAHQVLTGVCLKTVSREWLDVCCTEVVMREISEQEWRDYWHSGEPCDKAGGYAIQGLAARFITRINGSYSNVVGLPLHVVDTFWRAAQGDMA